MPAWSRAAAVAAALGVVGCGGKDNPPAKIPDNPIERPADLKADRGGDRGGVRAEGQLVPVDRPRGKLKDGGVSTPPKSPGD